jgi:CRP-like cAMP-binding protein
MVKKLEKYLADNFITTDVEISKIVKYFKHIKAAKNEVLIERGVVCNYFYFVINGCVRAYFYSSEGKESTRYVAFENQFISTIHSFIEQSPSNEYISAIEPSELLAISHTDFKTAISNIPIFKDLYIKQLERAYMTNHWRIEILLRLNAKQRYDYLLKNNKQIIQRLSNNTLASFLGITQESLSRLKAKK